MFKKKFTYSKILLNTAVSLVLTTPLVMQANTLLENVTEVLTTNPVTQEKLRNFRMTQQDLNIAQSEYYPSVDIRSSIGRYKAGNLNNKVTDMDYNSYQTSLTLTQNLFDGFGTVHKIDYQKARIIAAGYKYIEVSNDIAFKMTTAYLNLLRAQELLTISRKNVSAHEEMYIKVKDLFEGGLTTDSEVKKIASSLSLSRSNLTVKRNTALDREYAYKRILGRMPTIKTMEKPTLDIKMPDSIERATLYAIKHNPSLLVSNYNLKGSHALRKQVTKDYYPKVNFIIEQKYNDADPVDNGYDSPDDRLSARLELTYNLYRGGSDRANRQKHISMTNQEVDIRRDLQRQVIEDLEFSWNSYKMVDAQLIDLNEYNKFSEDTLLLYNEEFNLGRRTLLELLTAQNDAISSYSQVIDAQYDALLARYRILDAMGLLVLSIQGNDNIGDIVNISKDRIEPQEILDNIPIRLDSDGDNIIDNIDICGNSIKGNNIMPYGCVKINRDNDNDGISDINDRCPATPKGESVNKHGCHIVNTIVEENNDADIFNMEDLDIEEVTLDEPKDLILQFKNNSDQIDNNAHKKLDAFYEYITKNKDYDAIIVGHTSKTKNSNLKYNIKLSEKRAQSIKDILVSMGIDGNRLTSQGKGSMEPIADNSTKDGAYKNQRIAIKLIKKEFKL